MRSGPVLFAADASGDAPRLVVARPRGPALRRVFLGLMLTAGGVSLLLVILAMASAAFLPESSFGGY